MTGDAGDSLGMRVAPDDLRLILLDDGTHRWTGTFRDAISISRLDDPVFSDVLTVQCVEFEYHVHPWDGRTILTQWTK